MIDQQSFIASDVTRTRRTQKIDTTQQNQQMSTLANGLDNYAFVGGSKTRTRLRSSSWEDINAFGRNLRPREGKAQEKRNLKLSENYIQRILAMGSSASNSASKDEEDEIPYRPKKKIKEQDLEQDQDSYAEASSTGSLINTGPKTNDKQKKVIQIRINRPQMAKPALPAPASKCIIQLKSDKNDLLPIKAPKNQSEKQSASSSDEVISLDDKNSPPKQGLFAIKRTESQKKETEEFKQKLQKAQDQNQNLTSWKKQSTKNEEIDLLAPVFKIMRYSKAEVPGIIAELMAESLLENFTSLTTPTKKGYKKMSQSSQPVQFKSRTKNIYKEGSEDSIEDMTQDETGFDTSIRDMCGFPFTDFTKERSEINEYSATKLQRQQIDAPNPDKALIKQAQQVTQAVRKEAGVSYVQESESQQLHVNNAYEKLAPTVFQCSYGITPLDDQKLVDTVYQQIFIASQIGILTSFTQESEADMKRFLLTPKSRLSQMNTVFKIDTTQRKSFSLLDALGNFISDKACLIFFLQSHRGSNGQLKVINRAAYILQDCPEKEKQKRVKDIVEQSDIQLVFSVRKQPTSMASILKSYDLDEKIKEYRDARNDLEKSSMTTKASTGSRLINEAQQVLIEKIGCSSLAGGTTLFDLKTMAYPLRCELFVDQTNWKGTWPLHFQRLLFALICKIESQLRSHILCGWNQIRENHDPQIQESGLITQVNFSPNLTEKYQLNLAKPFQQDRVVQPVSLINTRDCFAHDLIIKQTIFDGFDAKTQTVRKGIVKRDYYFDPDNLPDNYSLFKKPESPRKRSREPKPKDMYAYPVGCTTYDNFFTHEELCHQEKCVEQTEEQCSNRAFLPMTAQQTFSGKRLTRTKFFFGYRYIWTRTQLSEPYASVAAGVRRDVSQCPLWCKETIERPLVENNIVEKDWLNSFALNVYHDGTEGLAQHYDDATRFKQPIYTLRLFSDSRLSFGSQYYGFCNSAFFVPLARGCVAVMQENSYAANGVKHCVRPSDMTGKSAAIILRQMHPVVIKEAHTYDTQIDLPQWFSSLTLKDNQPDYHELKRLEAIKLGGCS